MRIIILILSCLFLQKVIAQGGYLGSRNGLELKFDLHPSFLRVAKERNDKIVIAPKFFNVRTSFNYSKVVTRHAEVAIGYELIASRVNFLNYHFNLDSSETLTADFANKPGYADKVNWIIDQTRFYHHGLNLEYHYFRKGNLAPIGSYVGFALKLGYCQISNGKEIVYGDIGYKISEGRFRYKYEILERNTAQVNGRRSMITSHLNLHIGQNIPITKAVIFSMQLSLPVYYSSTYGGKTRRYEIYPNKFYDKYYTTEIEGFTAYTIGLFYRTTVDIGLKLML